MNLSIIFLNLIVACFLQLTVGWLSFASMGRIKIIDSEIVVDRNFKRYRLDPSTITVSLGKKVLGFEVSLATQFFWKEKSLGF